MSLQSSSSSCSVRGEESEKKGNPFAYSGEEKPYIGPKIGRRNQHNLNDIRIEVPEFGGTLDPDEFL